MNEFRSMMDKYFVPRSNDLFGEDATYIRDDVQIALRVKRVLPSGEDIHSGRFLLQGSTVCLRFLADSLSVDGERMTPQAGDIVQTEDARYAVQVKSAPVILGSGSSREWHVTAVMED